MDKPDLTRRDFQRLTMAAVGGLVIGSGIQRLAGAAEEHNDALLLDEPHVCRGLNACKGKGKGGNNACAGRSECATAEAHTCAGSNACKGQGGCGEVPGENACKGKGKCHVPLEDKTWKKTRAHFEAVMKKAGKKVGPAPKKA